MKKIVVLILMLSAFLTLSSVGIYAGEAEDLIMIEAEVQRTNEQIDKLIAQTLYEVSAKVDAYNERYIELTKGTEVIKLQDEVSMIENRIAQLDKNDKYYEDYLEKYTYYLVETEKMLIVAQEEVSAILEKELYVMEAEIDELINNLIDDTNSIAQQTIELGKKYGFIIICEWEEVEIYGEIYLIDPLRIIGG